MWPGSYCTQNLCGALNSALGLKTCQRWISFSFLIMVFWLLRRYIKYNKESWTEISFYSGNRRFIYVWIELFHFRSNRSPGPFGETMVLNRSNWSSTFSTNSVLLERWLLARSIIISFYSGWNTNLLTLLKLCCLILSLWKRTWIRAAFRICFSHSCLYIGMIREYIFFSKGLPNSPLLNCSMYYYY